MMEVVREFGAGVNADLYMTMTRVLSTGWTFADLAIIVLLIRTFNILRLYISIPTHKIPYVVLGITVPFSIALFFANSGWTFFYLELVITFPHFFLILYLLIANRQVTTRAFAKRLGKASSTPA